MPRYIKVHRTPPPGESIAIGDLDDRTAIAAGDIPAAEWDVEREDGTVARMTGQQILDAVGGGTPGTGGSGRPAEIEIENTSDGIRIRGKSGDDAEFGPWFNVRNGRDGRNGIDGTAGMPASIEIEDIIGGIRVRGKSGDDAEFGSWHEVRDGMDGRDGKDGSNKRTARSMTPFGLDGMMGRTYGPMIPFNFNGLGGMTPYSRDPMTGKPSGDPMRGRFPKKREGAEDILYHLDGQPDLVKEYIWDLIMDRVPELRNAEDTYNLIASRIQGYTDPFTPTEKVKLRDIETNATADMSASEIISLLNLLPKGERLNINWFDGELNIPTNTVEWHGQFQLNTAYGSGDMVIDAGSLFIYIRDVPATNTTRPAADTARAEHLDAGSPNDLVNATKSNLTFTLVRRSGDNINLEITNADIVRAFQGMTTTEKARVRTALDVPVTNHNHDSRYFTEAEMNTLLDGKSDVGHNHDDRYYTESESDSRYSARNHHHNSLYYTETESDSRFAPRSTISATVANVLRALQGMNTTQEGQARTAIKTILNELNIVRVASGTPTVTGNPNYLFIEENRRSGVIADVGRGVVSNSMLPAPSTTQRNRIYFLYYS